MPRAKSKFIDDECERGSDDESADEVDEEGEENEEDRNFIDDEEVVEQKKKRARLSTEEYELDEDDYELVREASKPKRTITRNLSESDDSHSSFVVSDGEEMDSEEVDLPPPKIIQTVEPLRKSAPLTHFKAMQAKKKCPFNRNYQIMLYKGEDVPAVPYKKKS